MYLQKSSLYIYTETNQRANYKIEPDKIWEWNSCRAHWCTTAHGKLNILLFCLFHESCTTVVCRSFVALAANAKNCMYTSHALKNITKAQRWHTELQITAIRLIFFDNITKHIAHWIAYLCFWQILIHFQQHKRLRLKSIAEDILSDFSFSHWSVPFQNIPMALMDCDDKLLLLIIYKKLKKKRNMLPRLPSYCAN